MSLVWLTALIPQNINNFKRDTMKANKPGGVKFYLHIYAQFALVIDLVEKTWNNNSCWMYLSHYTCLSIAAVNVTKVIGLHLLTVFSVGSKKKGTPIHWHQWHFSISWQVLTRVVAAALKIGWFTPVFSWGRITQWHWTEHKSLQEWQPVPHVGMVDEPEELPVKSLRLWPLKDAVAN